MKIIVVLIFVIHTLYANDFLISMLKDKEGDWLLFKGAHYRLYCGPHGVYTIDNFLNDPNVPKECKEALQKIKPNIMRRYAKDLNQRLHLEQMYHLRVKDKRCVVYFNDNKSYPQIMIQNGLGVIKKGFLSEDRWFNYRLNRAQKLAKKEKKGIWSTPFISTCFDAVK